MINILHAFYWFDEALQAALQASGSRSLTRTQSLVLCDIASGERRASRLARNLGVSRQAVNQVLNAMQAMGIITTQPDPDDSRALLVDFSEQAAPLRESGIRTLKKLEEELARRIGSANLRALRRALAADWGESPGVRATGAIDAPARKPSPRKRKQAA